MSKAIRVGRMAWWGIALSLGPNYNSDVDPEREKQAYDALQSALQHEAAATPQEKAILKKLSPEQVTAKTLAGDPIRARLTKAPGNGAEIGGLKVVAENGWFAARPSGTEDVYKIYAESFRGEEHLARIVEEARAIVSAALQS